jgi:hypothetical protein
MPPAWRKAARTCCGLARCDALVPAASHAAYTSRGLTRRAAPALSCATFCAVRRAILSGPILTDVQVSASVTCRLERPWHRCRQQPFAGSRLCSDIQGDVHVASWTLGRKLFVRRQCVRSGNWRGGPTALPTQPRRESLCASFRHGAGISRLRRRHETSRVYRRISLRLGPRPAHGRQHVLRRACLRRSAYRTLNCLGNCRDLRSPQAVVRPPWHGSMGQYSVETRDARSQDLRVLSGGLNSVGPRQEAWPIDSVLCR